MAEEDYFQIVQEKRRNKIVSIGGEALAECLAKYGSDATLDFLIRLSSGANLGTMTVDKSGNPYFIERNSHDWVAQELLSLFPTLVSWASTLKKMTCLELDTEVAAKKVIEDPDWLKKQGIL